jgi:hypothetical protein
VYRPEARQEAKTMRTLHEGKKKEFDRIKIFLVLPRMCASCGIVADCAGAVAALLGSL